MRIGSGREEWSKREKGGRGGKWTAGQLRDTERERERLNEKRNKKEKGKRKNEPVWGKRGSGWRRRGEGRDLNAAASEEGRKREEGEREREVSTHWLAVVLERKMNEKKEKKGNSYT